MMPLKRVTPDPYPELTSRDGLSLKHDSEDANPLAPLVLLQESAYEANAGGLCAARGYRFQIPFRVTLTNVERERGVLPRNLLVMREQLRAGGAPEAI
jgi:hypothetical protein